MRSRDLSRTRPDRLDDQREAITREARRRRGNANNGKQLSFRAENRSSHSRHLQIPLPLADRETVATDPLQFLAQSLAVGQRALAQGSELQVRQHLRRMRVEG